ncbi:glycosyltransferase family protein, partial [Singulisphaera rosea]
FARGWPEYEWRWKCPGRGMPTFGLPLWDGQDLAGRTILLHTEQGFGDTLQFLRFARDVKRKGGIVALLCPEPLASLLASCPWIDRIIPPGMTASGFSCHAPLMSLPAILGTTLETLPAEVPYLSPSPERVESWGRRLGGRTEFKVGITWQGNPKHRMDRRRSFALAHYAGLAGLEGVRLISLQKGFGVEQLLENAGNFSVEDLETSGAEALTDFNETAAVIRNLDLVVTADMSVAHLAGSLGAPVWVALSSVAEWRWMEHREDCPWYPSMRLFRQSMEGDWGEVFGRIERELSALVRSKAEGL